MDRFGKVWNIAGFYLLVIGLFIFGTLLGNRTVTVISQNAPEMQRHNIVIDAGHGGEDGGAISCSGRPESDFNLQIALRLDDLFHFLGYDTVMIRKTDTAVYVTGDTIARKKASDLKERVRIVNSSPNGILVSIHQNYFTDGRYSGAQVFYARTDGSEQLAELLQSQFVSGLNPESTRAIKKGSGIYLMENITVPGVLVECGFLSNAREEQQLADPDYQKRICCIIAAGMGRYLSDT